MRADGRTARVMMAVACIATLGCEQRSGGDPWVIPGPTVPSVALREPFVWDTREELMAWTDNAVTRGPFRIDTSGSSGAIAIDFVAGTYVLLRGPNLDPPLQRVRAVRIRYMWAPSSDRSVGTLASGLTRPTRRAPISNSVGLPNCSRHQRGPRRNFACHDMPRRTRRST